MVLLLAAMAFGCSCVAGLIDTKPADGEVGVSLDAHLWLLYNVDAPHAAVTLVEEDTDLIVPVSVTDHVHGSLTYREVVSDTSLKPDTRYELFVDDFYARDGVRSFSTGPDVRSEVPVAARIQSIEGANLDDPCGAAQRIDIALAPGPDDARLRWELQVDSDEGFGDAVTLPALTPTSVIGHGACGWDNLDLEAGARRHVRARAVTLDGLTGPWSRAEPVKIPRTCGHLPGLDAGVLLWLLSGLFGLRRWK